MTLTPYFDDGQVSLHLGNCFDVLPTIPDASIDAVVCDPPYALEFMGRAWDGFSSGRAFQESCEQWATECLRALKPGGYLLAFGAPRTYHRLACGIEDAGFEVKDSIHWIFGTGFPKGQDIGKLIDRHRSDRPQVLQVTAWLSAARVAAGWTIRQIDDLFGYNGMASHWCATEGKAAAVPTLDQWATLRSAMGFDDSGVLPLVEHLAGRKGELGENWEQREVIGERDAPLRKSEHLYGEFSGDRRVTLPASEAAKDWHGWNTQLKPAHEAIIVARKSTGFNTTVANVLEFGTGALHVDACRIPVADAAYAQNATGDRGHADNHARQADFRQGAGRAHDLGRWPSNVVFSHPGSVYYMLRNDAPEAVIAYYCELEAVREMPGAHLWDAVAAEETSVLQSRLRGRRAEGRPEGGVGDNALPAMRGDVRDASRVDPQWAQEVLLGHVPQPGEPVEQLQARQEPQRRVASEDVANVFAESADHGEVLAMEGRPTPESRLHARNGGVASGGDANHRAADDEGSLRLGTSRNSGRRAGPAAGSGRSSAPFERREVGQSTDEFGRGTAGQPHDGAPRDRTQVPDPASRSRDASCGERRLAVPVGLVPKAWLRHFDGVVEVSDCSEDGACASWCPVVELDQQSGVRTSGANPTRRGSDKFRSAYGEFKGETACVPARGAESGGASRYFNVFRFEAKAPAHERPKVDGVEHVSVKPLELMRWLVRLVTPPGGTVLDHLAGSGTTLEACALEGFNAVGIEREPEYAALCVARLTKPLQPSLFGIGDAA